MTLLTNHSLPIGFQLVTTDSQRVFHVSSRSEFSLNIVYIKIFTTMQEQVEWFNDKVLLLVWQCVCSIRI